MTSGGKKIIGVFYDTNDTKFSLLKTIANLCYRIILHLPKNRLYFH
jgi:hypothetical protein